jgi:hypothetical protein
MLRLSFVIFFFILSRNGCCIPLLSLARRWCCALRWLQLFKLRFVAARLRPKKDSDNCSEDEGERYHKREVQRHRQAEDTDVSEYDEPLVKW